MTSWKAEVIADDSGNWASNALRFRTKEACERYGRDLMWRWLLVRDVRATECDDPPSVDCSTVEHWEAIAAETPAKVVL